MKYNFSYTMCDKLMHSIIMVDIRKKELNCERCNGVHEVEIDFDLLNDWQKQGIEPVLENFICPNLYLMYRVLSMAFDATVNNLKPDIPDKNKEDIKNQLKDSWGANDFDKKIERFIKLDLAFICFPDEYYHLLKPIISSYACGYFYPAMTSAWALGERILNRLIIKLKDYYKTSKHYKKVYNKQSFDQWDYPIEVLKDWWVISEEVASRFLKLKQYRNDSIHYNEGYNFEDNAYDAIKTLANIIDLQFNYLNRKDLFWVFDVPGEIWVKTEAIENPFVKEFILPHCSLLGPYCEPHASPPKKWTFFPLKPFSDSEFIKLRKNKPN